MPKPVDVRSLSRFRVRLRYDDGVHGEVDLSHLAGRGVFRAWDVPGAFERVRIGSRGEIAWGGDLELCPDALYLRLTGKSPEQLFPNLGRAAVDA